MLRVFGCMVQYRPHTTLTKKFEDHASWGIHLGIESEYHAWTILDFATHQLTRSLVKQRPLRKINVSNAFLYAIFDVIIYFEQPHAFEEDGDAICLLQKSLYEIKQAPRLWQQYLHTVLIELDFQQLPHDQGMYRLESRGSFILRVAYVDDLLYTRDNTELLDLLEQDIKEKLEVTIDHDFTQFLGLNVSQTTDTIHLFAAKYAETLAKKFAIAPVGITTPFRVPPHNHEHDTTPLSLADHRLY
ncbi:unnamed protein product [Closterium sp. NIES-54]